MKQTPKYNHKATEREYKKKLLEFNNECLEYTIKHLVKKFIKENKIKENKIKD